MQSARMIVNVLFAIFCLTGITIADCADDNNWNFGMIGSKLYYAAVPTNGDLYVFAVNKCLDMVTHQCVDCSGLRYSRFFYGFDNVGKCVVTSIPADSRKRSDDMVEFLIDSDDASRIADGGSNDPTRVVNQGLPLGHIIWSVRCGIDLEA